MTIFSSFGTGRSLLETLTGESSALAPVDGKWTLTGPGQFELLARNLAYGLMVRDYHSGDSIEFSGCTDEMKTFVNAACRLAHVEACYAHSDKAGAIIMASDIEYLMAIGSTWSGKYKPAVDRTVARIVMG